MKVLIGITTRNRAKIVSKAIQSALEQNYENKEIAVFDDASTDETSQLKNSFPQVKWHQQTSKQGLLRARNYLMRETDADFYFSLDDDAWFLQSDEIARGIEIFQKDQRVAALAYDILSPDRSLAKEPMQPYPTHMFIGCGHMLRLSAVKSVGYYVPAPGYYGSEEKDLCLRLLDQHYEILYLPGVHVWHDKTTIERDIPVQHRSGVCNDLVFAFRRCPNQMLFWLLPAKILSHLRFSVNHDLLLPCLYGIGAFGRALPALISTRQPVSKATFLEFRKRSQREL